MLTSLWKHQEREQPAHLVVVECTTHVLASDALHEHHFFVGLYHLYNLWCATRDLLPAARPAKSQATSQVTSYFGGLQLAVQSLQMLLTALPASQDDLDVHSAHRAILEPALSTTVAHNCSPMHRRL